MTERAILCGQDHMNVMEAAPVIPLRLPGSGTGEKTLSDLNARGVRS